MAYNARMSTKILGAALIVPLTLGVSGCASELSSGEKTDEEVVTGTNNTPPKETKNEEGSTPRGTSDNLGEQKTPDFVTSSRGVSVTDSQKLKKDAKDVYIYFDFACPDCHEYELKHGEEYRKQVENGDINLILVPIPFLDQYTVDNYATRASSAFLTLAEHDPQVAYKFYQLAYDKEHYPEEGPKHKPTTTDQLVSWAREAGADNVLAEKFYENTYYDWVHESADIVEQDKVIFPDGVSTPTIVKGGSRDDSGKMVKDSGYEIVDEG